MPDDLAVIPTLTPQVITPMSLVRVTTHDVNVQWSPAARHVLDHVIRDGPATLLDLATTTLSLDAVERGVRELCVHRAVTLTSPLSLDSASDASDAVRLAATPEEHTSRCEPRRAVGLLLGGPDAPWIVPRLGGVMSGAPYPHTRILVGEYVVYVWAAPLTPTTLRSHARDAIGMVILLRPNATPWRAARTVTRAHHLGLPCVVGTTGHRPHPTIAAPVLHFCPARAAGGDHDIGAARAAMKLLADVLPHRHPPHTTRPPAEGCPRA